MELPTRPAEMIRRPVPDLTLVADDGRRFALRQCVGRGPLALFFYIRNGTPG